MEIVSLYLRAVAIWMFNNQGPQDVLPVAYALLILWCTVAFIYVMSFEPDHPPKFFGGPPGKRAHWHYSRYDDWRWRS